MRILLLPLLVMSLAGALPLRADDVDLSKHFAGIDGTFVLYDPQTDTTIRHNPERAAQRFSPFSTFKIPHALIGLDLDILSGPQHEIAWDDEKYPRQRWWDEAPFIHWGQDQTLATAMRWSVVWYFRELAGKIGAEPMQEYLDSLDYGNRDISSGINGFWLNASLEISADEQVDFLRRMLAGELELSPQAVETVQEITLLEEDETVRLHGKTGGGNIENGNYLGWFVGWVEREDELYIFALNIEGDASLQNERIPLARAILAELGLLD
jgi:beta-lactamase class D